MRINVGFLSDAFNTLSLSQIFVDGREALFQLGRLERLVHVFWLAGPFFLLWERTPGDIWLTVIGLGFLIWTIINKEKAWLSEPWVKIVFLFWLCMLISAYLSDLQIYSVSEAFVWFRFPLFAMASAFWLGRDPRLLRMMLVSTGTGVFILCCIVFAELLVEGQRYGRLYWPYGDPVVGNYLAKVGLPVFVLLALNAMQGSKKVAFLASVAVLVHLTSVFLTGERTNLLIIFCSGLAVAAFTKGSLKRIVLILATFGVVLSLGAVFTGTAFLQRNTVGFFQDLPVFSDRGYFKTINAGILGWKTSPLFGIGPGNHRLLCEEFVGENLNARCDNHPHNFYVQILEETGLVGLFFGSLFMGLIVWKLFQVSKSSIKMELGRVAWIVPFALFWPITGSADFFGQWNNVFLWSAVGLAISMSRSRA